MPKREPPMLPAQRASAATTAAEKTERVGSEERRNERRKESRKTGEKDRRTETQEDIDAKPKEFGKMEG